MSTEDETLPDERAPVIRDDKGRIMKGSPTNNPTGRPRGTQNRASALAKQLRMAAFEELMQKAIDMALAGEQQMLRVLIERILPALKSVEHSGEGGPLPGIITVPNTRITGEEWMKIYKPEPEQKLIDVTPEAPTRELTPAEKLENDPEFARLAPSQWDAKYSGRRGGQG